MTGQQLEQLKYPIGTFDCPTNISASTIEAWISILEHFPNRFEKLVSNLSDKQLDTAYRPGGWTVRQVVHHVADSHHHSYTRFKWAMTENNPVIKAYNEQDWATQHDYNQPIEASLMHIKAIHTKLVYYLKKLSDTDLQRAFVHPESGDTVSLSKNIGIYAWHSNHHYTHVEALIKREGWV